MNFKPLAMTLALLVSTAAQAAASKEESYSYPLSEGGRLSVANVNGSITITGGSGKTVEIKATKKADREERLKDIKIKISHTADSVDIETDLPGSDHWFSQGKSEVTYVITVPESAELDSVNTVNGEVKVSGVSGNVAVESVNGDLELSGLGADAKMSTVNGSIEAAFVKCRGHQKVKAETVNGSVVLSLPRDADTDVSVDTLNGSINARDFKLDTDKGFIGSDLDGEIGGGSASVSVDTVNGSVKIKGN